MFFIDAKLKAELKKKAAQQETTIKALLTVAIENGLRHNEWKTEELKYYHLVVKNQTSANRQYLKSGGNYTEDISKATLYTKRESELAAAKWFEPVYRVKSDRTKNIVPKTIRPGNVIGLDGRGRYNVNIPAGYTDIVNKISRKMKITGTDVVKLALEGLAENMDMGPNVVKSPDPKPDDASFTEFELI
jgi:hypothetical protein